MYRKRRKERLDSWYHLSSLDHGILILADLDSHELKCIADVAPYSMQIKRLFAYYKAFLCNGSIGVGAWESFSPNIA